ncbi:PREDICTED: uncharacterized protein LOC107187960 isoform X2 [Dufourea novaeangliae]|uniref:uncharacterized protein LOC107187960 isoform X2 n=1 Tax=Dufourea novaeangliae TaxID=178035 RepID=UPI000767AE77|nr:PREDICTED: uncharacterized protein LOC107187960 isoform X2 [Dufourea novaeangliae]
MGDNTFLIITDGRAIEVLDEKEEGEISLEDVSSSEEGHPNYGYGTRASQCSNCLSTEHNTMWCPAPAKFYRPKGPNRRDAVQGKENRHQVKETGCFGAKHVASTLQEKNDDLVPISSDSDMEIVGLADNSKQIVIRSSKVKMKKKKKRKRTHASILTIDDLVSSSTVDISVSECVGTLKHNITETSSSRSHHREISPPRRPNRPRVPSRSPPRRHRSLVRPHSPFRRSKSPVMHARSPPMRRSPRRLKSPKRSPYRSPGKTIPRKTSHIDLMSSSHNYTDNHKLLKKVRHLDSIGTHSLEQTLNKNKEHASSLKEKLSHMMKGVCDNNSDITNFSKDGSSTRINKTELNDPDDEEDIALLRQKALETKQKKSNKQNEQPITEIMKKVSTCLDDDQDEEDLELRMIALRSAVLKKHQNRVQKGMKSGKYKKSNVSRSESPFTQSFLDSIPIPGEELLHFASPPHTPLPMHENNHTEDMDIDTDVEREKEKLPYSPTDKITVNIPIDTELLGIQPSDVSFINLNEINNSPSFHASVPSNQDDQKSYQGKIIENRSYLTNVAYYAASQNTFYSTPNTNMQYSPTNTPEATRTGYTKVHNPHVNVFKSNNTSNFVDNNLSQETPYSPTDTPVYDPDLSHALSQTLGPIATSNSSLASMGSCTSNVHENNEQYNHISAIQHTETIKQIDNTNIDEHLDDIETLSMNPAVGSDATSLRGSVSPASSLITIDDLPETDVDASPLIDSIKNGKSIECIPENVTENIKNTIPEPLYMKGIPDVTKDINKIPTLISRTLVPSSILKTNKQLQQTLPVRKTIIPQEPTFKNAEMQPVTLNDDATTKTNTCFKPMKLMSFPQKSHSVLTIPTAFHDSLYEDHINKIPINEDGSQVESNNNATLVQNNETANAECPGKTCDNISQTQKKKKSAKKGVRRKSTGSIQLVTKEHNTKATNSKNVHMLDKQINNTAELAKCNNIEDNTNLVNLETSKDGVNKRNRSSSETNESNVQHKDTFSGDVAEQVKNTDDRRQSLDEDEEALRAILLASLPKRTKITNQNLSTPSTTVAAISNSTNQILTNTNQTVPKVALSIADTVNVANTKSLISSSNQHANSVASENDKNQSNSKEKVNNTIASEESPPSQTVKTLPTINSGRKRLNPTTKGPQKKVMKRIPIPASTKVVNNAKKYQNTMIQKKLNVQKAVQYSKQKITENKIVTKVHSSDNKWSANTKIVPDTQKIVINLESDTESDSESEQHAKKIAASINSMTSDKHQSTANPTAEFEKNLDQFLRAVRKKQESMAAARPTPISQTPKRDTALTTKLENSSNHTPLAVRHLPASQQEEYHRLKQQILEREKLKLHRTTENNSSVKNTNIQASSKSVPSNSPNRELHSKISQIGSTKNQNLNTQLNKENYSKNLDVIKHTNTNKINSMDKEGNTNPSHAKIISNLTTNLNIRISNENSSSKDGNSIGKTVQLPCKVFESQNEIATKHIVSQGLKILSTDEVNRKFVQIQVKSDTNERVVTIHDKVTLNNETVISQNENISGNKDTSNKSIGDQDINQPVQSVENEIITSNTRGNNDTVDSDASTVILSKSSQTIEKEESVDTSESTIRLSQYEGDNNRSLSSVADSKDDSFSLFNSNLLSNDKKSIEENWDTIKRDVKTELNTLMNLSRAEQERRLMDTEQKLVLKRYNIVTDLAEMSGNLREWHVERDLQTNLVAEVKKLREQLKVAEERLQLQRNRINSIGPKVVSAHAKINTGRQECFKLARICSSLGSRIVGKEYKVPDAGAQLVDSRLKEVANHTRELSRKKVPSISLSEAYGSVRLEDTVSTVHSDLSQSKILLEEEEEDIVNNVDTTILSKNDDYLTETNESEDTAPAETTVVNIIEHVTVNDSSVNDNEDKPQENNMQEEASSRQLDLCSAPVTVSSIPPLKDSQTPDQQESSENNTSGLTAECSNQGRTSAKPEVEQQIKKMVLPYESILVHFKVPRNTNPNGVLCPYDLMGTCNDGECHFVHQRENQAK